MENSDFFNVKAGSKICVYTYIYIYTHTHTHTHTHLLSELSLASQLLLTNYVWIFLLNVTINSYYFNVRHSLIILSDGSTLCSL